MSKINSITINGNSVNFKDGLTIKDVLNVNLDTGVLVLPNVNQLDVEPMDEVVLTFETNKIKKFLVGTINQKISSFASSKKYLYEIGLVSLAVKLQRIILPSRSITNSLDGSADLTIKKVLENYLSIYAPDLSLSSALINKLGTTLCPETQWNRPTLFEVFNDLLKPLGSVVTMTDTNVISFLDLYTQGTEINQDNIVMLEVKQDITSYVSAIETEASNVYDKNAITKTPEKYSTKTLQQGLLTTENDTIVLQKPIFDIVKITCTFPFQDSTQNNSWQKFTLDITDRVVNKKVYDTFYPATTTSRIADTSSKKYVRNYLYYTEGSKIIDGLKFRENNWLSSIGVGNYAIDNVIYWKLTELNLTFIRDAIAGDFNGYLLRVLSFDVQYLTTDKILFRSRKSYPVRNESILINGQSSPIVNAKLLAEQQQEFVNRVGNKEMIINGRYTNFNNIPEKSDFITFNNEKFILTEREIVFNQDYYNFKGVLSANYSMDNMFAGISTERRFNAIASPNEALVSNHLTEVFTEINNSDDGNSGWSAELENYIVTKLGVKNTYIQGAVVSTDEISTIFDDNEILLETTTHAIGNSVIITLGMTDNFNSHLSINQEFLSVGSQQMMDYVPYVDENGRFEKIKIELYRYDDNINNRGIHFKPYYISPINQAFIDNRQYFENAAFHSSRLPVIPRVGTYQDLNVQTAQLQQVSYNIINTNARVFTTGEEDDFFVKRYKDNREITQETIQIHFQGIVSNPAGSTKEIFVTNLFTDFTPFVYSRTPENFQFRIAYSNALVYNVGDKVYKGTLALPNAITVVKSGNQINIESIFWDSVKNQIISYAICDSVGNVLIAVNKNGNYEPLYINRKV
jgi:hypothetical protein